MMTHFCFIRVLVPNHRRQTGSHRIMIPQGNYIDDVITNADVIVSGENVDDNDYNATSVNISVMTPVAWNNTSKFILESGLINVINVRNLSKEKEISKNIYWFTPIKNSNAISVIINVDKNRTLRTTLRDATLKIIQNKTATIRKNFLFYCFVGKLVYHEIVPLFVPVIHTYESYCMSHILSHVWFEWYSDCGRQHLKNNNLDGLNKLSN